MYTETRPTPPSQKNKIIIINFNTHKTLSENDYCNKKYTIHFHNLPLTTQLHNLLLTTQLVSASCYKLYSKLTNVMSQLKKKKKTAKKTKQNALSMYISA